MISKAEVIEALKLKITGLRKTESPCYEETLAWDYEQEIYLTIEELEKDKITPEEAFGRFL